MGPCLHWGRPKVTRHEDIKAVGSVWYWEDFLITGSLHLLHYIFWRPHHMLATRCLSAACTSMCTCMVKTEWMSLFCHLSLSQALCLCLILHCFLLWRVLACTWTLCDDTVSQRPGYATPGSFLSESMGQASGASSIAHRETSVVVRVPCWAMASLPLILGKQSASLPTC